MKNNKLIAEFMGEQPRSILGQGKIYKDYSKSWDWLMPVVQKIMDVSFFNGEPEDFYVVRDCIPEISDTYKAVVEFIKLYNKDES